MIIKITPMTLLLFIIVVILLLGIYAASVQTRLSQFERSAHEDKLMIKSIYQYIDRQTEIKRSLDPHLKEAIRVLEWLKPKVIPQLKENVLGGGDE